MKANTFLKILFNLLTSQSSNMHDLTNILNCAYFTSFNTSVKNYLFIIKLGKSFFKSYREKILKEQYQTANFHL